MTLQRPRRQALITGVVLVVALAARHLACINARRIAESTLHAGDAALHPLQQHASASRQLLIEDGQETDPTRFPYVAVVAREDGSYLCVGTLIHPRVVVTAAHCVAPLAGGSPNPHVHLGQTSPTQVFGYARYTSTSVQHPEYVVGSFDYDLAILLLDSDAQPTPVRLCSVNQALPSSTAMSALDVVGWGSEGGSTLSPSLRLAPVEAINSSTCAALFKPYGSEITRRMLCVTGRTCAGDSGGPLIALGGVASGDVLVAQVSFGFPRKKGAGCPVPNPASVFTDLRTPRLNAWLRKVMAAQLTAVQGAAEAQQQSEDASGDAGYMLEALAGMGTEDELGAPAGSQGSAASDQARADVEQAQNMAFTVDAMYDY